MAKEVIWVDWLEIDPSGGWSNWKLWSPKIDRLLDESNRSHGLARLERVLAWWTKRLAPVQLKIKFKNVPYDEQIRIARQAKTIADWCRRRTLVLSPCVILRLDSGKSFTKFRWTLNTDDFMISSGDTASRREGISVREHRWWIGSSGWTSFHERRWELFVVLGLRFWMFALEPPCQGDDELEHE